MSDCCSDKSCEVEALRERQASTLKAVLGINGVMFVVEFFAGIFSGSVSLLSDSLDMLGDALAYGFSLYAVGGSQNKKALSALFKGIIMTVFGLFAIGQAIYKIVFTHVPSFEVMGVVGLVALVANFICFILLLRHRADDINMRSVWLCSRNDVVANIAVVIAAALVWFTGSAWPDIVVGLAIAALFLKSASSVLSESLRELRRAEA